MMVQEVTVTSWGKRMLNAFGCLLFGIILIVSAIYLIFWDEEHGWQVTRSLQQMHEILVPVSNAPVDSKNNQRLIYISGLAKTNDVLQDEVFKISGKAIQLSRHVEMYQWQEGVETKKEKQVGGSEQEIKTYTYQPVWSSVLIDSTPFKESAAHQNPKSMPLKSQMQHAKTVTVGDFSLPFELIAQIKGDAIVDLSKINKTALKTKLNKPIHLEVQNIYLGDNPAAPKTGDIRIKITKIMPQPVSIIAQQTGSSLQAYMTKEGQPILLMEMGQVSAEKMIHHALRENQVLTWLLRLVSLMMLVVGFALMFNPVVVFADAVPFFGSITRFGTGLVAFICGASVWSIAVIIACVTARVPIAVIIFILALMIICYVAFRHKKI